VSIVAKAKSSYKITNWREYNESLVRCGDDADQVDDPLGQIDGSINAFYGDGAYDEWKIYETLAEEAIHLVLLRLDHVEVE
jgi:hypothetical protein